MLIKKLYLENIRSHVNTEIDFQEGKTLLAGNIGSGKSSILLAIDFALFGIAKGVLPGSALLRNGHDAGKVKLHFSMDENEITIERKLKKSSSGISQETGSISINGNKTEKSAVELKQAVLELLNYPQELLTKGRGLIYRYTVYTPQEEMKQILLSPSELRLDILRRVFGIDKYKRIKENSSIFLKLLRDKKKSLSSRIMDLEDNLKELSSKEFESFSINSELKSLLPLHSSAISEIENVKKELHALEEKKELRNAYIKNLEIKQSEFAHKALLIEKNEKELSILQHDTLVLENEIKISTPENASIDYNIKNIEANISSMELELRRLTNKQSEFMAVISHSKRIIDNIKKLDFCPTCNQLVTQEHKHSISSNELAKISSLDTELKTLQDRISSEENSLSEEKSLLSRLQLIERQKEIISLKSNYIQQKYHTISKLENENKELLHIVEKLNDEIKDLKNKIAAIGITDYERLKEVLDKLLEKERTIIIKKSSLERDLQHLSLLIDTLKKEVEKKSLIKSNIDSLSSLYSWIEGLFIPTIEVMEKKIMLKLHSDFNSFFEKWFDMLVGNDNLKISIAEDFSPKILQDGYDMEYENLSGGEKTAAALAYRLALNQVINNLISNIKTHDLLILDEPTDGFSDEQLDGMKLVLDELKIKQILIVSHEDKIESFVDNIIRFQKEQHVTRILN